MTVGQIQTSSTPEQGPPRPPSAPPRPGPREVLHRLRILQSTASYVACAVVALTLIFAVLTSGNFLNTSNLQSIGRNSAGLMLLAVGLAFVLGAGHIDLSVGSTLVLSSVVSAKVIVALAASAGAGWAIVIGAICGVLAGAAMGLLNGVLVTRLRINSFVVTLGTMGVGIGLAQVITNGSNVIGLPTVIQRGFGIANWFSIPKPLLLSLALCVVAAGVLTQTVFGRHALASGSSEAGARRAGVKVDHTTIGVFLLAGAMAGVAGFLDITRFGTTAISGHETTMLQALSAVIIGGTSLFGGRASVLGAMIATFISTVLLAGFVMVGVSSFYQRIAIGVVLIIAVWVDRLRQARAATT
ncbi:ABC transporter permease [Micromonospora sp. NPDC048830]|uniref:ABC transporter permease n=1 Tax=Micromonospora sp. NPDC048830 TaxID=3364257 RepID=UPI00371194E1